jgi:hypothetical protein
MASDAVRYGETCALEAARNAGDFEYPEYEACMEIHGILF